jgi:hypothetical protein
MYVHGTASVQRAAHPTWWSGGVASVGSYVFAFGGIDPHTSLPTNSTHVLDTGDDVSPSNRFHNFYNLCCSTMYVFLMYACYSVLCDSPR